MPNTSLLALACLALAACSGSNFASSSSQKTPAKQQKVTPPSVPGDPAASTPTPKSLYVPVGGQAPLPSGTTCAAQDGDDIASSTGDAIKGKQAGQTTLCDQKIVVYDPVQGNVLYIPLGGQAPLPNAQSCPTGSDTYVSCSNSVVTGSKIGQTTLATATPVTVVVFDPSNPPDLSSNNSLKTDEASQVVCSYLNYKINGVCKPAVPVYHWACPNESAAHYSLNAKPACQGKTSAAPECGGETVNEFGCPDGTMGMTYQKIAFYTTGTQQAENEPIPTGFALWYRTYHSYDHLFTQSVQERDQVVANGYISEGAYLTITSPAPHTAAIYRWENSHYVTHMYTRAGPDCAGKSSTAPECHGEMLNEDGYTFDGLAGYFFVDGIQ